MEENNSQTQDTEGQPNTQVQEPQPVKPQKKKSDIWSGGRNMEYNKVNIAKHINIRKQR